MGGIDLSLAPIRHQDTHRIHSCQWHTIFFSYQPCIKLLLQVLIGGGKNHRMGLFDMVMIKDNHISIAGGITNALESVDLYLQQRNLQMEVEVMFPYSCLQHS